MDEVKLLPCRECGSDCRIETFGPNRVIAGPVELFVCANNRKFGGDCPSDLAYFGAHAWNDANSPTLVTGQLEEGAGASPDGDRACAPSGLSRVSPSQAEPLVPSADDGGSYRMNPRFQRFLEVVGSVDRAMAAWDIAMEALTPSEAEFVVWQGDEMVAGCSGPRASSLAEAIHYAVVYQTDDQPCVIQELVRREIDPDAAHAFLASVDTQPKAGDVQQAPLVSGAVGSEASETPTPSQPGPSQ